jgi:phage/plasmid primase-like uncharacterized protein
MLLHLNALVFNVWLLKGEKEKNEGRGGRFRALLIPLEPLQQKGEKLATMGGGATTMAIATLSAYL